MNNKSTQHIDSAQPVDELKNYIPIIADELELCKRQAMPCLGTLRLQLCRNVETIQNSTDRIVRVGTYGQKKSTSLKRGVFNAIEWHGTSC